MCKTTVQDSNVQYHYARPLCATNVRDHCARRDGSCERGVHDHSCDMKAVWAADKQSDEMINISSEGGLFLLTITSMLCAKPHPPVAVGETVILLHSSLHPY